MPNPPALHAAATSSGPVRSGPMGATTIGASILNRSQNRVRSMSRSSSYESKMGAIGLTMQSRLLGPAPAKGSSGRCQLETATRKAEPLTGPGPRRRCLLGSFPIAFLFVVGSRVRILLPPSASPANSACDRIEPLAGACPQSSGRRIAKPNCLVEQRLEHRRQITGRGVDDLQYLGSRGLLLERSRQFNGALLQRRFAIGNARDENPCRRRDFSDLVGSPNGHFGRTPFDLSAHVLLYPLEARNYRAPHIGEDRRPGEHAQQRGDNDQEVEMRDGLIEVCGAVADLLLCGAENRRYRGEKLVDVLVNQPQRGLYGGAGFDLRLPRLKDALVARPELDNVVVHGVDLLPHLSRQMRAHHFHAADQRLEFRPDALEPRFGFDRRRSEHQCDALEAGRRPRDQARPFD